MNLKTRHDARITIRQLKKNRRLPLLYDDYVRTTATYGASLLRADCTVSCMTTTIFFTLR